MLIWYLLFPRESVIPSLFYTNFPKLWFHCEQVTLLLRQHNAHYFPRIPNRPIVASLPLLLHVWPLFPWTDHSHHFDLEEGRSTCYVWIVPTLLSSTIFPSIHTVAIIFNWTSGHQVSDKDLFGLLNVPWTLAKLSLDHYHAIILIFVAYIVRPDTHICSQFLLLQAAKAHPPRFRSSILSS